MCVSPATTSFCYGYLVRMMEVDEAKAEGGGALKGVELRWLRC